MNWGDIISIGFLVVLVALVLWNIRGHKGPIDRGVTGADQTKIGF